MKRLAQRFEAAYPEHHVVIQHEFRLYDHYPEDDPGRYQETFKVYVAGQRFPGSNSPWSSEYPTLEALEQILLPQENLMIA